MGPKPLMFHDTHKWGVLVSLGFSQPSLVTPPFPATQLRSERERESERGGGRRCGTIPVDGRPLPSSHGSRTQDEQRREIERWREWGTVPPVVDAGGWPLGVTGEWAWLQRRGTTERGLGLDRAGLIRTGLRKWVNLSPICVGLEHGCSKGRALGFKRPN